MVICLGSSVSNDGGVTLNYGWDWNYWEGKEMARFNMSRLCRCFSYEVSFVFSFLFLFDVSPRVCDGTSFTGVMRG